MGRTHRVISYGKQAVRAVRMKRRTMTMPVQQKAINADTAMTRTDVVHLLQEVGNPEQLDVSNHDLRGINLMNGDLRGANLSQASVCEANLCGANLSKADLHGADLSGTYLCWADLHGADLRGANLDWATLYGAFLGRAYLRGTSLNKTYVRGADLSWACFGEASDSEQLKHRLWRRGAIFRETTNVRVSEAAGRHALGFALGFVLMSLVGLLCVLGIRVILTHMRLKRHPGDRTPRQVGTSPECRS